MSFFIQLIKIAIYSENSLNSICLKIFLRLIRFVKIKNREFNNFKDKKKKNARFSKRNDLTAQKVTLYSPMFKLADFLCRFDVQSHNDTLIISIGQKNRKQIKDTKSVSYPMI